jgi:hypothetical protein
MALPTFFIIGAPKTGTTSLHNYLAEHPQIQMSSVKEPNFFAPHLDPADEKRRIGRIDKYEQLFDPAIGVRGESSTPYAEYPLRQGVPERIKELVPAARFIYVVRDPVARTVSHYNHNAGTLGEAGSLEETLGDLSDPRTPSICASLYAMQLELYLRCFAPDRVLVIDQAELHSDRRAVLREAFAFLGVEESFDSPRFDEEFLKTSERRRYPPRFARFVELSVTPRLRWLPPKARLGLRRSVEKTVLPPLQPAKLDDEMRARLEEHFAGEARRLRELTGKPFSSWSV